MIRIKVKVLVALLLGFNLSTLTFFLHRYAVKMVGQARLELATPRLSSVCSNQLSYRPL